MARLAPRIVLALAMAVVPSTAAAQSGDWPTLTEAGLEYLSKTGFFQATLSGQLDVEAFHVRDSWAGLVDHEGGESALPENWVRCTRCHVGMAESGDGGPIGFARLEIDRILLVFGERDLGEFNVAQQSIGCPPVPHLAQAPQAFGMLCIAHELIQALAGCLAVEPLLGVHVVG